MLYSRKGDKGSTKLFGCDQKISKSSAIAEALGAVDEINSLLGLCKVEAAEASLDYAHGSVAEALGVIQQNLFIIQAELAGADKIITAEKVKELEVIINAIEVELPPITSFFVSGGTRLAAMLDFARTVSRRAERRVVTVNLEREPKLGEPTLAYLNRLSSALYAFARLANHQAGITEEKPHY